MSTKENDINKLLEILSCSDSIDDLIKKLLKKKFSLPRT